jgi:hypothetical protein
MVYLGCPHFQRGLDETLKAKSLFRPDRHQLDQDRSGVDRAPVTEIVAADVTAADRSR